MKTRKAVGVILVGAAVALLAAIVGSVMAEEANNTPPVVGDIPDQAIAGGEGFAAFDLDDYVDDPDNTDDEIEWAASGNVELAVVIDEETHEVTITPPSDDWCGSEEVTFTATDPDGGSDSDAAAFTVTCENEPPEYTLTITDGGSGVLSWVQAVSVVPLDPGAEGSRVDSPSDPVEFSLPEGDYEIVISVLRYGRELIEIPLGRVELSADTAIDLMEAEVPFELFIPR